MRHACLFQFWQYFFIRFLVVAFLASACCVAQAELISGITIEHGGLNRTYDLFIPNGIGSQPLPLVLDLHPFESDSTEHRIRYSPFDQLANTEDFLVAFPQGVGGVWNFQTGSPGADDVDFLRAVVADVNDHHSVDNARIYATGFSQGGGMVNRLACDAADLFAAFSTMAGPVDVGTQGNCNPVRAIPFLSFHGTNDPVVPYEGGPITGVGVNLNVLSAADTFEFWRSRNACAGPVNRATLGPDSFCDSDMNCANDTRVDMCTVLGAGFDLFAHIIYNNSDSLNLAQISWEFFERYTVPGVDPGVEFDPGFSGNWWKGPERSGEGAQIEVADGGGGSWVFVATVYSYDIQGNQIFLVAVGPVSGATANVDVFITEGGVWGEEFDPAQISEIQWGSGTFTANSCTSTGLLLSPNSSFQALGYTDLMYDMVRLTTPVVNCPLE
jgi:polyhydroxybutyrate depolymerase